MKAKLALLLLPSVLLLQSCSCGKPPRVLYTRSGHAVSFRTAILAQRGYLFDSRYDTFDLYTGDKRTIAVSRELKGIRDIWVSDFDPTRWQLHPDDKDEIDRVVILRITYRSGEEVSGVVFLHWNEDWDYFELKSKEGVQKIPLRQVSSIHWDN